MRVLGIDVETTGLSAAEDRIIEVGCCLWDWDSATPLVLYSTLVDPERPIPPEITKLTGITDVQIEEFGQPEELVMTEVTDLIVRADYVMAHNAVFDHGFYDAAMERQDQEIPSKPWLCSMQDIKWPAEIVTRKLSHLAADHGFISIFQHRAIFDVLTMLKIASEYRLEDIVKRAQEPTLVVQAIVSFEEKEKAKERGYRWYGPTKTWWKSAKLSDYQAEKDVCGFKTVLLEKAPE